MFLIDLLETIFSVKLFGIFTWSECISTCITSSSKFLIVAISTENQSIFGCKWFFDQTDFTFTTFKTFLVPMQIFVGHIFGVESYPPFTNSTIMSKILLIAGNATRMLICENVNKLLIKISCWFSNYTKLFLFFLEIILLPVRT